MRAYIERCTDCGKEYVVQPSYTLEITPILIWLGDNLLVSSHVAIALCQHCRGRNVIWLT